MNVELSIEELVLRGFTASDRQRIGEAVERELSRLFAEQGMPASLGYGEVISRLDGGALKVAPGTNPDVVGVRVAQSLYESLAG